MNKTVKESLLLLAASSVLDRVVSLGYSTKSVELAKMAVNGLRFGISAGIVASASGQATAHDLVIKLQRCI